MSDRELHYAWADSTIDTKWHTHNELRGMETETTWSWQLALKNVVLAYANEVERGRKAFRVQLRSLYIPVPLPLTSLT